MSLKAKWIRAGEVRTGDWWCKGEHGTSIQVTVSEVLGDPLGRIRLGWEPHGQYDWAHFAPNVPLWIIRDAI